ncbi:MAG: carbon-nitrogen hydrolase family protein [Anaerolineae bacterium]|nr:carbon-nitrogen hydrolase family protein [Anaerolineae bacterium]
MKICVAQSRPFPGNIARNSEQHQRLIATAVPHHPDLIIFPELSLTGYEPTRAKELAMDVDDGRLAGFQTIADARHITIGVGAPIIQEAGICIGLVLFQPGQPRQLYAKKYLHADEEPFFVSGHSSVEFLGDNNDVALAICYELSVPAHAARAHENGAAIYIASIAKYARGVVAAHQRLAEIARAYGMSVLMCNSVGQADGDLCTGNTAVWNAQGTLLGQLDDTLEGILIFDTDSQELTINQTQT